MVPIINLDERYVVRVIEIKGLGYCSSGRRSMMRNRTSFPTCIWIILVVRLSRTYCSFTSLSKTADRFNLSWKMPTEFAKA